MTIVFKQWSTTDSPARYLSKALKERLDSKCITAQSKLEI